MCNKQIYVNYDKIYSYNTPINIIEGARGCGKTFGAKERVIKNFIKDGSQFIYIRRREKEILANCKTLFSDLNQENIFEENVVYKLGNFYYKDKIAGFPVSLINADYLKSSSFPNVTTIIFDEYALYNSHKYLPNEVTLFVNFVETVIRQRNNCKILLLGNSYRAVNPYTIYYNVSKIGRGCHIFSPDKNVVRFNYQNDDFAKYKQTTLSGKLVENKNIKKHIINNEYYLDNNTFIEKKTGNCKYFMTFISSEKKYGVWINYDKCKMFISYDYQPECKIKYTISFENRQPNTMLFSFRSSHIKTFRTFFENGRMCYDDNAIKNDIEKLFI